MTLVRKQFRLVLCLVLLSIPPGLILAQEDIKVNQAEEELLFAPDSLFGRFVDAEIKRSSIDSLRSWAESLGIVSTGSKEELTARLRGHYSKVLVSGPVTPSTGQASTSPGATRTITIRNAGNAAYFTLEDINQKFIRLQGGVRLEIVDGDSKTSHDIRADEIIISQDDDFMTARGSILYVRKKPSGNESFSGSELFFNATTNETWLLDGTSLGTSTDKKQSYQSASSYRSPDDVTILRDALLSASVWDPPAYQIRAQTLYLLQPGEWFLEGAMLYIGHIPLFYFPYFYNPSDSLVFHPSTGYKAKEGTYIQTTTYLLGRKGTDQPFLDLLEFSLPDSGNADDFEEKLQGLYLRKTTNPANKEDRGIAKIMFDYYARMGYYGGLDYSWKGNALLKDLNLAMGLGLSRNLYASNGAYDMYYVELGMGREVWGTSNFYGTVLPFRYYLDLSGTISLGNAGSFRLKFPFYSDPAVRYDFSERSEDIEWAKLLGIESSGAKNATSSPGGSAGSASGLVARQPVRSNLDWSLVFNYNDKLFSFPPFFDSLQLRTMENIMRWKSIIPSDLSPEVSLASDSSSRTIFIPESLVVPSLGLTMNGTLFKYPFSSPQKKGGAKQGDYLSPWEAVPEDRGGEIEKSPSLEQEVPIVSNSEPELLPPYVKLAEKPAVQDRQTNLFEFSSVYTINPNLEIKALFPANNAVSSTTILYGPDYWSRQILTNGTLTSQLGILAPFIKVTDTLTFQDRRRYVGDFATRIDQAGRFLEEERAAKELSTTLRHSLGIRIQPLTEKVFSQSNISYDLQHLVYRYDWDESSLGETPRYDSYTGQWTDADVTTHRLRTELKTVLDTWNQTLSLDAVLPPKVRSNTLGYATDWSFAYGSLGARTGVSWFEDKDTHYDKLYLNSKFRFFPQVDDISMNQSLVIDMEKQELERYDLGVKLWAFNYSMAMNKNVYLGFDKDTLKIVPLGTESFKIDNYRLSLVSKGFLPYLWENRLKNSYDLDLSYAQSLVDIKNATLSFAMSLTFGIHEFLDLTLKVKSSNRRIFQYFPSYSERLGITALDFWEDLAKSFNFFDTQARQASGFKLQSFDLGLVHYLGDWNLIANLNANPKEVLQGRLRSYTWDTLFSVEVAWKPLPILKKDIRYVNGILSMEGQ